MNPLYLSENWQIKYLTLPDPKITITQLDSVTFELNTQLPAKGVWLTAEDDTRWSDNMLDLLPGDSQVLVASQLSGATLQVRSLR